MTTPEHPSDGEILSSLLENPADAIIAVDDAQRIVAFSRGGERMFGYAREEVLGQPLEMLLPATLAAAHRASAREFLASAGSREPGGIVVGRRKDGSEFTAECVVSRYAGAGRVVAAAIVREVNGPARAEALAGEGTARDHPGRPRAEELLALRAAALAALNETGQALSRLAEPAEILERIYAAMGRVLDNRNTYIALVDDARQQLTFPIYAIDGARRSPAGRPFGNALTEYIIRTGRPLLVPREVSAELRRLGVDPVGREARSFLGVPMIAGDRVLGVIAVQDYEQEDVYTEEHRALLATFAAQAAIALENARLYEEARRRAARQEALAAVIAAAAGRPAMPELLATVLEQAVRALGATAGAAWVGTLDAAFNLPPQATAEIAAAATQAGLTAVERTLVVHDRETAAGPQAAVLAPVAARYGLRAAVAAPVRVRTRRIGAVAIFRDAPCTWTPDDVAFVESVARELGGAAERQHAEEKILSQLETLSSLYAAARKLSQTLDLEALVDDVVRTVVGVFGAHLAFVGRAEPDFTVRLLGLHAGAARLPEGWEMRWDETPAGNGPAGRAVRSGFPVVEPDLRATTALPPARARALLDAGLRTIAAFPLVARERAFGVLGVGSATRGFFTPARVEFFQAYAHLVAAALENARLLAEASRRLEHLQALRDIDAAITGSLDARVTMGIFLDKATTNLGVDAAALLVFNPITQTLEFLAGRGFRSAALQHTRLQLGQGYAGRAALERATVSIPDLRQAPGEFERSRALLQEEGVVAYHAVPLVAKGQVKGVLEVFHRGPLAVDGEWMDFLVTLAGQAAVALDSAAMFETLQRANAELMLAYDTTLEGWVRTLDLRDKETEGHTQRVTELTLRLARAMGMAEEQLVHVRRGALLHDIGKMGIPDSILLKPGPLTEEEWAIMRKHPVYARELLAPIAYLRPALPIPYCHHERWDGSGYPQGLKGEEIPLEARIFAVVDVWDALTSDRPYRPAWTPERARDYIREQAGTHFDPQVVSAFLTLSDLR